MKITRQSSLLPESATNILRNLPFGEPVTCKGKTLMRLKPTSFILNSTLVGDILNRGDVFVCNLEKGTVYAMPGDTPIEKIDATFLIKEL